MGRGTLVFKGDDKTKKKKKKNSTKIKLARSNAESVGIDSKDASTNANATSECDKHVSVNSRSPSLDSIQSSSMSLPLPSIAVQQAPMIQTGTGQITTSGTVVTGYGTRFQNQLSVGDAVLVLIPDGTQEMRVVTMLLSDKSINLSSSFSKDVSYPTAFQYINKPRNALTESHRAQRKAEQNSKQEEQAACGLYGVSEEPVYRERTEHGSYRIKKMKIEGTDITRTEILEMRSKKKSDKYC